MSTVRSTNLCLLRQTATSRFDGTSPQEFTKSLQKLSKISPRLLESGKTARVAKILDEAARLIRRSIERGPCQGEKPAHPAARQSILRTFSPRNGNLFPRTHLPPRIQFSDRGTARHDTRSALARVGITIRNKYVYVIERASEGASSLVTPLL